jgi:hypothetical protein
MNKNHVHEWDNTELTLMNSELWVFLEYSLPYLYKNINLKFFKFLVVSRPLIYR